MRISDYDLTWRGQSETSADSMPLGGRDAGCNVWAQDGQLFIRLACADPASFQTAVGAQDALRSALERSGENVRVEIVQSRADGGNEGDARQQSRGHQDYVPDVE